MAAAGTLTKPTSIIDQPLVFGAKKFQYDIKREDGYGIQARYDFTDLDEATASHARAVAAGFEATDIIPVRVRV